VQEPAGQRGRAISGERSRSRLRSLAHNPNQIFRLSRDFYTSFDQEQKRDSSPHRDGYSADCCGQHRAATEWNTRPL
jgi:hypothetical protein